MKCLLLYSFNITQLYSEQKTVTGKTSLVVSSGLLYLCYYTFSCPDCHFATYSAHGKQKVPPQERPIAVTMSNLGIHEEPHFIIKQDSCLETKPFSEDLQISY
ncbi:unnamed protein product [Rangifer tarandus platyrhynchus]|uniref:Uncharacterized protein n=2 Tax=Rangifer tarandus platyrhynchus TaxID=3082113 RepID=A0AC59Z8Y2_RANTA|nr:unnamed protein product [Rangifer tarandus platyrhynchus]